MQKNSKQSEAGETTANAADNAPGAGEATGAPVAADADRTPLLEAEGLTKTFFGNTVLDNAALTLYPGEVHGVVGENGAGKSTLMKLLAGVYERDAGVVRIDGKPVHFSHPVQAHEAGLSTVFQEFNLLPDRTVAENIYLGREPRRAGFVNKSLMNSKTGQLLESLGIESLHPTTTVRSLSVAEQQIVEIAKAVSYDARIISMDEPTAALAGHEVELLYGIINRLKQRGVGILYVSHRLREIFELCDTITVLKDGRMVSSGPATELDDAALVRLMVGRSISSYFPPREEGTAARELRMRLQQAGNGSINNISLELHAGEIVGLAGLQGSGRTELVEAIFGVEPFTRGTMTVGERQTRMKSARQAIKHRMALITEDRKAKGLSLNQSIFNNALSVIRAVFPGRNSQAQDQVPGVFTSLEVIARDLDQEVQYLSGGNQQKVVLAKWLAIDPQIVLLDEPTRGIDVGAKYAVYTLMRQLAAKGVAILMVSSELPEVLGMSDRILVMRDGAIAGELPAGSSEEDVLNMATGARQEASA